MSSCTYVQMYSRMANVTVFFISLAKVSFSSLSSFNILSGHSVSLKSGTFWVPLLLQIILQTLLGDFFFFHQKDTDSKSRCSINVGTLQPVFLQPGIQYSKTFEFYSLILTYLINSYVIIRFHSSGMTLVGGASCEDFMSQQDWKTDWMKKEDFQSML